jgi:AcrR family transcriptional regulator
MSTKEKILQSAKKLFSKQGFEGTSVRDICQDANTAVSGINYHFKSKEGLLQKIFEEFGEKQLRQTLSSLSDPTSMEGFRIRLEMFVDSILNSYLEDPQTFILIQREIENRNPNIEEIFKNTTLKTVEYLIGYFENAKKAGLLDPNVDMLNAVGMLLNHISNQIRNDEINKSYFGKSIEDQGYRKDWIISTLAILINGIKISEETK